MSIGATLVILALWMAFIWFVDPDGISRGPGKYTPVKVDAAERG
jgi:hypothetical protein